MEEPFNCADPSPLQEMAQRRMVVHLMSGPGVLAPLSIFRHNTHEIAKIKKVWQEAIEPKIRDRVLALNLPKVFKQQLIEMVRPTGLQMKRWKDRLDYHFRDETLEITLPRSSHSLCWTRAGLIDYHKTAKELSCCADLDVVLRFELASIACLENDIPLLWDQLPRTKKLYFFSIVRDQKPPSPHLYFCWPHILKGRHSNLDYLWRTDDERNLTSFNQWGFEESAEKGNKMATQYFLGKLTPEERRVSLVRTALAVHRKMTIYVISSDEISEVFFFLLSVMTPQQRLQTFAAPLGEVNSYPGPLRMLCFFDQPWPDLFLEDIRNFWSLIPPLCYDYLYNAMFRAYKNSDSSVPKLFPELFVQSPPHFKELFIDMQCRAFMDNFLHLFLESEDSEAIRAIFRNVSSADVEKLANQSRIFLFFDDNILANKWLAVRTCLQEAKPLQDAGKTLKEVYMDITLSSSLFDEGEKQKFKSFFEYLNGVTDMSADQVKKPENKKHKLRTCFILLKQLGINKLQDMEFWNFVNDS